MSSDYDRRRRAQLEAAFPVYCAPAEPDRREVPVLSQPCCRCSECCPGCDSCPGWRAATEDGAVQHEERGEREITLGHLFELGK